MSFKEELVSRPSTPDEISRPKCSVSPINQQFDSSSSDTFYPVNLFNNFSYMISPYLNKVIQPKYTTLPLNNLNQYDSGLHLSYQNNSFYSPTPSSYLKKSLYESTPNKFSKSTTTRVLASSTKVNFHSISDLAMSSSSDESSKSLDVSNGNKSEIKIENNSHNNEEINSILFSENLRLMSQSMANKENSNDFISKTKRKPRTQINKKQKEILEYAYKMKSYPDSHEIEYLCNLLGFEENVIRIWFQNKRARNKNRN